MRRATRREFVRHAAAVAGAAVVVPAALGTLAACTSQSSAWRGAGDAAFGIRGVVRRDETLIRYGGNGDNWHISWGRDNRQYLSLCDGAGFTEQDAELFNGRMLAVEGGPDGATFHDLPGYPQLSRPARSKTDTRYYPFGTLALDGALYQFLSTMNRPIRLEEAGNPSDPVRFVGVKVICSRDGGRTWRNQDGTTPVAWEPWSARSRQNMLFLEEDQEAFSLLTVLQMGRGYALNRDGYVYVYSTNGNTVARIRELVMFRVRKDALLHRSRYEFFAGRDRDGGAKWTSDITARGIAHTFPGGWANLVPHPYAWYPSVAYIVPLDLYLMVSWGMGSTPEGMWFGKPNYLGFWVARKPWGPWVQIHEDTAWTPGGDAAARCYQPQIAPKWIAADGRSFWLVWTDFQGFDEYAKQLDPNAQGQAEVTQRIRMMRRYMPYYGFNTQRFDILV